MHSIHLMLRFLNFMIQVTHASDQFQVQKDLTRFA